VGTIWPRLRFLQLYTRGVSSRPTRSRVHGVRRARHGVSLDAWVLTDSRRQSTRNFLHEGCGLRNANSCGLSWDPASILRCRTRRSAVGACRAGDHGRWQGRCEVEDCDDESGGIAMSFLGPRTLISNNVQRAGNSSPPRSNCRRELQLGLARDIAHSFFAHFEGPSARGGWRPMSTALNGPAWVGAWVFGHSAWLTPW
jgi:hypothetical protein